MRYTDATGTVSTTTYDLLDRPLVTTDGKGTQTRAYDPTSGLLTRLEDSAAGAFTATYDPDGNALTKTLPNGLVATTRYDTTGAPVGLTYDKQNCAQSCRWLAFEATESIHGQWLAHDGTLSSQRYAYDAAGRLTTVHDRPQGQGCTVRTYTFDANSNRRVLASRAPATNGSCDTAAAAPT